MVSVFVSLIHFFPTCNNLKLRTTLQSHFHLFEAFKQISFLGNFSLAHVDKNLVRLQNLINVLLNSIPRVELENKVYKLDSFYLQDTTLFL